MKATNAAQPPAGRDGLATVRAAFAALTGICYPAMLLFRGNMRVRQRRAWAGYLWLVLPGIAITIAFSLLRHGSLFVVGPIALPYPTFALSGVFLWQCFTDGLTGPLQVLNRERYFLSVNAAPHGAILLAGVLENLLALGVRMALLLVAMLIFRSRSAHFGCWSRSRP